MKNKLKVFGIFSSFAIALTGLSFALVNKNAESENKKVTYEDFYEAVNEVEGVFDEVSAPVKLTPKNAYESDTLLDPIIKVQISDLSEEGKRSIRFVAAIPDLNLSAKFVRSMYDEEGNEFQSRKEYQVTEAYTSILAGSSSVLPSSFGEGYNYFVTYTMVNIPNDFWYHALDVDLVLEATTESNIKLESNGSNEANVEGLMTNYYESYFDYNELSDGTYEVSVKQDKRKDQNHHRHEIGNHKNERDENRPNIAKRGKEVTSIAANGFYGCEYMNEIVLPKYLKGISSFAFDYCNNLKDVFFRGTIKNWLDITFSGEKAQPFFYAENFYVENKEEVTEIVIPKEITEIKQFSFYKFKNLESIVFEEESCCTEIKEWAFAECYNLKNIDIPEGVIKIGNYAFYNCTSLSRIVIPSTLQQIGKLCFGNCILLNDVYYAGDVLGWCNIWNNLNSSFDIDSKSNPMYYAENFYLRNVDEWELLTNLIIPNGITNIGRYTFYSFEKLVSVSFSNDVVCLNNEAFAECINLTKISLPDSLETIYSSVFRRCINLKNIALNDGLVYIGDYSFNNCESLENINIPENVTYIGTQAFSESGITSIAIPEGITQINSYGFINCECLVEIKLPLTLKTIGYRAFNGCKSLLEIVIPNGVKNIEDNTFDDCTNMQKIVFSNSTEYIGYCSFYNCHNLIEANIPEGTTYIGEKAFYNCINLKNVELPSSLKSINSKTFYNCNNLVSILISKGVEEVKDFAFSGCRSLISVVIPEGVSNIGIFAFDGCSSLVSVVIPRGVINIGVSIFSGCYNLTIYCEENEKPSEWTSSWNSSNRPVYYAGEWEYVDGVPTPIV